ncbi:hypothetical protein HDU96_009763 [Phlyctochytrium bullatum]|nr:hypothetical protein HDU96_009763 [Phlyctochytrium bullatum]
MSTLTLTASRSTSVRKMRPPPLALSITTTPTSASCPNLPAAGANRSPTSLRTPIQLAHPQQRTTAAAMMLDGCGPENNSPSINYYPDGPVQILPNLFLGSEHNAANLDVLARHGVKCVLNVAKEVTNSLLEAKADMVPLTARPLPEIDNVPMSAFPFDHPPPSVLSTEAAWANMPFSPRPSDAATDPAPHHHPAAHAFSPTAAPAAPTQPSAAATRAALMARLQQHRQQQQQTPPLETPSPPERLPFLPPAAQDFQGGPSPSPTDSSIPSSNHSQSSPFPPTSATPSPANAPVPILTFHDPPPPATAPAVPAGMGPVLPLPSAHPLPAYLKIPWGHGESHLISDFTRAFSYIDAAVSQHLPVLVACQQGVSRSASLVMAYVMAAKNMGVQEAYAFVKERSPSVCPNVGFMAQLVEFEMALREVGLEVEGVQVGEAHGRAAVVAAAAAAKAMARTGGEAMEM